MTSDESQTSVLTGKVVDGKYELHQVLGTGGMGSVVRARHRFTHRWVAIKLLHEHIARSERFAERFLREAQTAARLRHHRVVDVLDAGRDQDGALYIAFELLEGEDLNGRAQKRPLTVDEMVETGRQALEGLSAAHDAGLIHRDIKPANVFLEDSSSISVKLVDFGIAARLEPASGDQPLTKAGMVMGTPVFMSPEQMCADPLDGRTDFWSLAVSLFYSLTLNLPFREVQLQPLLLEVMQNKSRSVREFRPELGADVEAFFRTAFDPAIENRFSSAEEMSEALLALSARGRVDEETEVGDSERPRVHPGLQALMELESEVRRLGSRDTLPTGESIPPARPE